MNSTEKCTCGHTKGWHFASGGSFRCHGGDNCPCQNYRTDEIASSTSMNKPCCEKCYIQLEDDKPPTPCEHCPCHLPKEKCECGSMGTARLLHAKTCPIYREQPPAPEKKWEELLLKAHVYDEFRYYDAEGEPTRWKVDYEKLKAIIASILEEKAVEVQDRKAKQISPQKKLTARNEGYNEGLDEAAAILRR